MFTQAGPIIYVTGVLSVHLTAGSTLEWFVWVYRGKVHDFKETFKLILKSSNLTHYTEHVNTVARALGLRRRPAHASAATMRGQSWLENKLPGNRQPRILPTV